MRPEASKIDMSAKSFLGEKIRSEFGLWKFKVSFAQNGC